MLTLGFNQKVNTTIGDMRLRESNSYYRNGTTFFPMRSFRFSPSSGKIPYMIAANPFLHKGGVFTLSREHPFSKGRGINMVDLKEILDNCPIGIKVKFLSSQYLVGKGFIAKITHHDQFSSLDDKVELLFVVAQDIKQTITDPNDFTIYLNRELYEPQYKRVMAVLKPYMTDHKGDIIVTRSINNYLLYKFKLPSFPTIQSRFKFEDNMKEFFFRSIKWSKWRKDEDERLEKIAIEKEKVEKKRLRDFQLQEAMLGVINAENIRLSPQIVEPELVEEVPTAMGESEMNQRVEEWAQDHLDTLRRMEVSLREEIGVSAERIGEIPQRSTSTHHSQWVQERMSSNGEQETSSQLHQQEQETTQLSNQQLVQRLRSLGTNGLQQQEPLDSSEELEQLDPQESRESQEMDQDMPSELTPTNMNSSQQGEYVSPEEMERIMNRFAIRPSVDIEYSTLLHAATGLPTNNIAQMDGEEADSIAIDENTEIVIEDDEPDEEELERLHSASEEDLDNDPDAYEDADVIEPETRVFRAMEGGRD